MAALAAAFPEGVAHLAVIDDMIHERRDVGDAIVAQLTPADHPTRSFSDGLPRELRRFLAG